MSPWQSCCDFCGRSRERDVANLVYSRFMVPASIWSPKSMQSASELLTLQSLVHREFHTCLPNALGCLMAWKPIGFDQSTSTFRCSADAISKTRSLAALRVCSEILSFQNVAGAIRRFSLHCTFERELNPVGVQDPS